LKYMKRILSMLVAVLVMMSCTVTVFADRADFKYNLVVTDEEGRTVTDPRTLPEGSTLNVELELTRTDTDAASYETYGMEFRLLTRGLRYNGDGASFRNETSVKLITYDSGDSVGFAYYDMQQVGERIANPVLVGKWSYTITDPSEVNISVLVALLYIVNDSESYEPVGNAILHLDPNGGEIKGTDVSGEYQSGTIVTLPDASFGAYKFLGWSDGVQLYQAGSNYTVNGIMTLVAEWEGMEKSSQILFYLEGGVLKGSDPSGMYADGEIVILPEVTREGYKFLGWDIDGTIYQPGDRYVVRGSEVIKAVWEADSHNPAVPGDDESDFSWPFAGWFTDENGESTLPDILGILLGLLLLGLLLWWLFLLWDRQWVKYSLKDGSIALDHKEEEHNFRVEVILINEDEQEIFLGQSRRIARKHRLRFIKGRGMPFVARVDTGKYKGKLVITDGPWQVEKECQIKVLDRELRERKNK